MNPEIKRRPLDLTKVEPSIDDTEVLQNTWTIKGEPLTGYLYSKLQTEGEVAVILLGESGGGKTTLTSQVIKDVIDLSQGDVWLTVLTSGSTVRVLEEAVTNSMRGGRDFQGNHIPPIGPDEKIDRSKFTPEAWDYGAATLSQMIGSQIESSVRPPKHLPSYTDPKVLEANLMPKLLVADIAGIGKNSRLAAKLGEVTTRFPENVTFLVNPANPEIQDKALKLRNKAHSLIKDLLSVRGYANTENITEDDIVNIKTLTDEEAENINKILKEEQFASDLGPLESLVAIREGARPGRFEVVRDKYMNEVWDWLATSRDAVRRKDAICEVLRTYTLVSKEHEQNYAMKLAYAQYDMERLLGIDPNSDQGRVIIIPFLRTTIHQWTGLMNKYDK